MLTPDYAALWASMAIVAARLEEVERQAEAIIAYAPAYRSVGMGVPWWWVGCIHQRESGGDFTTHLHNGDPLTARTVHVPIGRPLAGRPPFSWVLSAQDALMMQGLGAGDWSVPEALRRAEDYNGFGYANRGLRSPYLWGGTNHQQAGKYVADGTFDPKANDHQLGVAPVMSVLAGLGVSLT